MPIHNIADLKDPNDKQGRSYREVNNAKVHLFQVGDLVEVDSGIRLYITKLTRDCDGTPLYSLGNMDGESFTFGYSDACLTKIDL